MAKTSIDDNMHIMHIICLQEGKAYTLEVLDNEIQAQLRLLEGGSKTLEEMGKGYEDGFIGFVRRLKESLQDDNLTSGDKDEAEEDLEWVRGKSFKIKYIGLYAYSDSKGNEIILYFAPKFVHAEEGMDDESVRKRREQLLDRYDRFLLAIDRYQKDQARLDASWMENSDSRVGLLPLVVMLIRDYLEYGLYTVHYNELEHNGQGEINWERTINGEQPFVQRGRPVYMDYWTEQTLSDENNYFTRLHACLLSVWGKKLADCGLSEVLNISIPSLSEAELDEFGDEDYIRSRIRGELGCQFVTHSRRTLQMIEALVTRTFEAESLDESALSFGMGGVAALWEEAINKVLGSQLDCRICDCGGGNNTKTFRESIPYPIWQEVTNGVAGRELKESNTWRPDFVRVWKDEKSRSVFVILDAKYYSVVWNKWGHIQGEPGIESISKQFFYKTAYQGLVAGLGISKEDIVNAFVFPALGEGQDIEKPQVAAKILWSDQRFCLEMFGGGDLHAVKLSGHRLLDSYASYDDDKEDWMKEIIRLCREEKGAGKGEGGGTEGEDVKGAGDTDTPSPQSIVEADAQIEVSTTDLGEEKSENAVAHSGDSSIVIPNNNGEPVSPIKDGDLSKDFIRDVISVPSCSGREKMMQEYIIQFATVREIEFKKDTKGNIYLTKGKTTNEKGYYPCLVNHMDTAQKWQDSFVDRHERLNVCECVQDGHVELYTTEGGIGADDKLGCAIALALVDMLPVVKAAFFVEEERYPGMLGSRELDRKWFDDVGFCLSFDSPDRNRSSRKCAGELLYSDVFFRNILKSICDEHGITVFNDTEPFTDVVQILQKTRIMCYNVGNGGYHPHAHNEFLVVEDAQAAYKFGFDLLRKIGQDRYWFGDNEDDTPRGEGGGTPKDPGPPEGPVSDVPVETDELDGSGSVSSTISDVCNCRMESVATKSESPQQDTPDKGQGVDGDIASNVATDMTGPQTKEQQIMPGLKIYHGSRIEDLAEKLVEELKAERKAKGPFEFLQVAVANPNLGNWLKMKVLAKVPQLSAGIEMPFLDDRFAELVRAEYTGDLELVSGRDYPAFVLDAMMNHWRDEFLPFLKYIKDAKGGDEVATKLVGPLTIETQREARKAVQLSDKLAQLIDAYEATGYLGLLEENKGKNEVCRGEQALAETLFGKDGAKGLLEEKGKISLRQLFETVKGKKPDGTPERIVLFGQTALTDLQVDILVWLSQAHEVIWYCPANVRCANGNDPLKPEDTVSAYNREVDKTIQKLCQRLKGTNFADKRPEADSTLSRLQVKLSRVEALVPAVKVPQDASVQIVGAPGIRREVELVYNAILGAVWDRNEDGKPVPKKDMSFSDIAVLVPDMPTYRPMIEAVFDGRGQIPYGLVDATTQDYSTYLDGFLALMGIARYGLSRKRIFAALENPCVQRAMGFSRDDVVKWLELTKDYGAYEGYRAADSDEGNVSGHFNWEWALRRMRLGLVAQDIGVEKGSDDKLPLEARDADDVCKFSEVVETLFRKLSALSKMPPAACSSKDEKVWENTWAGRLHKIMDEFLAVDKDDGIETLVRARIVRTLNGLTTIAGEQSYKLPVAMVEHCVAGVECAKGGYLRHGVTIGGLRSLANVPFKQIFVLGLGEGVFPGRNASSTLDVRNELKAEDRADLLRPEENRARFRAAVLSARDRLVLTYPNREPGSDAKLYPSSPVYDVEEVLTKDVTTEKFKEFKWYPLVEYAGALERQDVGKDEEKTIHSAIADEKVEPCFGGLLPTYSKKAYILSGRKPRDGGAVPVVVGDDDGSKAPDPEKVELGEPTAKDLAEFVKDPFTAILKRRLGIAVKGYRDHTLFDASPLGIPKGPVQWELEREIVTGNFEPAFVGDMRKAHVPHDFLGEFAKRKISSIVSFWKNTQFVTQKERDIVKNPRSTDVLAVICKSFKDSKGNEHIQLPPSAVLEAFFTRLESAKKASKKSFEFAVKVLNVEKKEDGIGCWKWDLDLVNKDADNYAGDYYEAVRLMYLGFLTRAENHDSCPSFRYDDLREHLINHGAYNRLCAYLKESDDSAALKWQHEVEAMSPEEDNNFFKKTKNAFDNDPVVMRVLDAFQREPTGDDLRKMFKVLYMIPMSGKECTVANGGAQ